MINEIMVADNSNILPQRISPEDEEQYIETIKELESFESWGVKPDTVLSEVNSEGETVEDYTYDSTRGDLMDVPDIFEEGLREEEEPFPIGKELGFHV